MFCDGPRDILSAAVSVSFASAFQRYPGSSRLSFSRGLTTFSAVPHGIPRDANIPFHPAGGRNFLPRGNPLTRATRNFHRSNIAPSFPAIQPLARIVRYGGCLLGKCKRSFVLMAGPTRSIAPVPLCCVTVNAFRSR